MNNTQRILKFLFGLTLMSLVIIESEMHPREDDMARSIIDFIGLVIASSYMLKSFNNK